MKAQSSMEFFALIGLAFLAVILFTSLAVNETKEFSDQREFLWVKDLALKLQKEVNLAALVEDGYERSFTLEDKFDGKIDYFTIVTNSSITVNSSNAVFSVKVPLIYGKNFTKGTNKIEKIDGEVYINK
jgi:uncharacterized protein YpmS